MNPVVTKKKGGPFTMETDSLKNGIGWGGSVRAAGVAALCLLSLGCARLPVPTQVIHDDQHVLVRVERVGQPEAYTHPITLSPQDVAAILTGFSARGKPAGALRWFGKPAAPDRVFREEAIRALAPYLAEGLRAAKPDERVAFAVYGDGKNPNVERVVTSGWIAVRDPFLHVEVESIRSLQPRTEARGYYPFYPDLPSAPPEYEMYFEPRTFWQRDPADGMEAVQLREYLKFAVKPGGG